jgi:hypothetical protein
MTDAEVFACVKLVRGSRASSLNNPFSSWTFGNLRLTDAVEFLPRLDLRQAGGGAGAAARLDVVVGPVVIEQWVITPGKESSDATTMSLFARTLFLYLRSTEIYGDIARRRDVDVRLSVQALLPSDAAHRQVWTMGPDGTSVSVTVRPSWKRDVETADAARAASAPPDTSSFGSSEGHVGSAAALSHQPVGSFPVGSFNSSCGGLSAHPTPPMAPQKAPTVGSYGTSPSAPGSFLLGTSMAAAATGPIQNGSFMLPPAAAADGGQASLPTLVPLSVGGGDDYDTPPVASPTVASPPSSFMKRRVPLIGSVGDGLGDVEFDDGVSPSTAGESSTLSPHSGHSAGMFPSAPAVRRAELTELLAAIEDMSVAPIPLVNATELVVALLAE